jgi:hypothetical protein
MRGDVAATAVVLRVLHHQLAGGSKKTHHSPRGCVKLKNEYPVYRKLPFLTDKNYQNKH